MEKWEMGDAFVLAESKTMTQTEAEALVQADAAWLARERLEHDELILSLEDELDALLETMRSGEPSHQNDATKSDPPGWPDL